MTTPFERYQSPDAPIADETWAWNMYGAGVENIGRNGRPERFPVPEPGADQLLVRVDAVGMCFSDVKLIQQGGQHPKLYNRLIGRAPLDGAPQIDVGRIHYDYTAYIGTLGPDIATAYGEARNRSEQGDGNVQQAESPESR